MDSVAVLVETGSNSSGSTATKSFKQLFLKIFLEDRVRHLPKNHHQRNARTALPDATACDSMIPLSEILCEGLSGPSRRSAQLALSAHCRPLTTPQRTAGLGPFYRSAATRRMASITGEEKTFDNCFGFEQGLWWCKTGQLRQAPQTSLCCAAPRSSVRTMRCRRLCRLRYPSRPASFGSLENSAILLP